MSLSQQTQAAGPAPTVTPAVAMNIARATQDLADVLRSIEANKQPMSAATVQRLEAATKVLQDLVEKAG